ncbi:MAG: cysteine desulfurase family protein [Rhizobiaceae bacterium]
MGSCRTYLDYNASAPLRPCAREAMIDAMSRYGNPSSVHGEGRDMRRVIEKARKEVADLVGADREGVVFTSSATEAVHLALTPKILSNAEERPAGKLYVLETEHPCVLTGGQFDKEDIIPIPVLANGLIDVDAFKSLMEHHNDAVPYVALQLVNSETGIVQPVAKIAQIVRFMGGYTFCDAVQAVGRLPIDVKTLGVDFLALSAHKIGGPQGVGALIIVHSILSIPSVIKGGGQEANRRAGTENVAAIAGFGAAAREALSESKEILEITALRDSLETRLLPLCKTLGVADLLTIFGTDVDRVGNTLLFSLEGIKAETALIAFDLEGIAVSSGSACSSGKVGASHVLSGMAVAKTIAQGAIRVSLGWNSTAKDTDNFMVAFERIAKRLAQKRDTIISGRVSA